MPDNHPFRRFRWDLLQRNFNGMRSHLAHLSSVLALSVAFVLPASTVAHGRIHHEMAHAGHADTGAGFDEVDAPEPADHPHFDGNPVVRPRVKVSDIAPPTTPEAIALAGTRGSTEVTPAVLDARAPPGHTVPADSRPRSPPLS